MRLKTRPIILYFDAQHPLLRYSLAVLASAAATLATLYIPVIGERAAFLLFFFAVILSSFWLGRNPGLLAMTLSLIAANSLVLVPASIGLHEVFILNTGFCFVSAVIITTTSLNRGLTAALWESRQDLDHAQAVGQIGSWRLNVLSNELCWSDESHRIFGIPKGTPLTYETFLSTVHPEDREYVDRMWQAGLRGEPYDIEHRLIVAGKIKWVRERAVLEFGKNGNLLGGFGITQDITGRKRSELLLEESRRRYAGIVESAMDAIITIDADQRILVFNAAAEKMFACKSDEAIGGSVERFIPERFRTAHAGYIRAFGDSGTTIRKKGERADVKGLRANGEEFPIEASISQCEIDGEKSFTAILRDVTERERIDRMLKERLRLQDQLAKVAASAPGLIYSYRLRPDGSAHMPYASPVFESIFGLSADGVSKDISPVFANIHPDDIGQMNDTIAESARTLQPWRDSFRYNHPTKGEIWIEGHSMPLRETDGSILWHGYIRDFTVQKQSEAELQKRIARYELVLEGAQDAIWDWDVLNKRVNYSSRWKALRGFAENEVGNDEEAWRANIHPDDSARVSAAVQSHFEGKTQVFCEEYRIRCKDGSWKWILDRGICQRDTSGQVIRMAGSENDITERKLAEAALLDRETELRLIMDATPALISYLDTDFRYLRVNKTYENWFCMTQELILGHEAREIIGEKAWHIVRPYLERARGGESISFDQIIPYGTGKPRWVHASYIPDIDSNGDVKSIVVHIVDIEDRKKAELERHKFVSLADNSQEFIGMCDMNFMPFYVNAAGMQLVGLDSLEQALLTPVQDFFFPEDQRFIIEEFFPRVMRERRGEVEIRFRHFQTGAALWMLYNVFYITNDNGEPVGLATVSRDITASKLAESALRESEEQLRQAKNAAALGIYDHDLVSGTMQWDERVREIWGVKPNETITLALFLERVCPEDRASMKDAVGHSFDPQGSGEYYAEYRVVRPIDNQLFWVAAFGTATFANDRPVRLVGFVQDITERKRAEAALAESEERIRLATKKHLHEMQVAQRELEMQNEQLRQASTALEISRSHYIELYDFAPVGYLTLTKEGLIAEINLTAANLLGVACNKLIHWRFAKFIADDHKDQWFKFSLKAMQQDGKQSIELPLRREDGAGLFVHFDCEYKQAVDALPLLHIALTDITERSIAEAALRESETRLALVVEEVRAGYWDWDLMTNAVYLSPEWKRQIGFDENELLNQWEEWQCRLHPDDRTLVSAAIKNYIAGLLPVFEVEFRLCHKDGSYRWIHSRGGLLRDQNNQAYRMLGINLDITDFKKTKELSERREQMEKSCRLAVAGQTVAAIAHDLNQPLAAISSYADVALLMLQTGNRNPQKLSHVLENCALQAQRAGDVIRQLMTVLHKDEAISEPIDINSSVRQALDFVKADLHLGAIKIKPDLAAGLPPVTANSLQIQKVLVNLLRNGLESIQESGIHAGTMTVTTRSFLGDPDMAMVTVCDSGKSVADPATLKTMFQPFYTTKPSGLGMGLAISRALIEAHGGKMWAEQNADKGISVHFTLPFVI